MIGRVLAAAVYLLMALALFHRAILASHAAIGLGGDPYLFQWHLAWVEHALTHGTNPLFSKYLAVPNGGENLMYYTSLPLAGLVLSPITALGGSLLSYNVLMVGSVVVSAWAAYAMCARFVGWRVAALVGGAVYGFSPLMVAQSAGHPQVTMAWFPPVVVIVADSIARGKRSPRALGVLFGLAVTAQLLLGTEVLVTSALVAVLCAAVWVVFFRGEDGTVNLWRRGAPTLGVAAVTVAVVGSFPLSMLLFYPGRIGIHHAVQPLSRYVADLAGFFVPGQFELIATAAMRAYTARFSGNRVESAGYLGLPLLLLLVFYLWKRWADRTVRLSIFVATACALFALGSRVRVHGTAHLTAIPLPGAILFHVPVLWNIVPARFMLYVYLAVALTVASVVDRGDPVRRPVRLLAVAAGLVFLFPASAPALAESTPSAFRTATNRGGLVLVTPGGVSREEMLWQADTGFAARLVGGFTLAPRPPNALLDTLAAADSSGRWPALSAQRAASLRGAASQLGVTTIVDVPDSHELSRRAFLTTVFGPAQSAAGRFAIWNLTT